VKGATRDVVERRPLEGRSEPRAADSGTAALDVPFLRYAERRAVVFPNLKVFYVPVPKASCTSILWHLAALEGIPTDHFARSILPQATPSLTIHDLSLWPDENRLLSYDDEAREELLAEDGWFRFSVVRNPGPRLWSAWQSKLLLREPQFLTQFGSAWWFPREPDTPEELVEDFRRFVSALDEEDAQDVHWSAQRPLVEYHPLDHVGRVERLDETLSLLAQHVGGGSREHKFPRENTTLVPMPSHAFDSATAAIANRRYAEDFERYGYEAIAPGDSSPDDTWVEEVGRLLPAVRDAAARNTRMSQLHKSFKRTLQESPGFTGELEVPEQLSNLEGRSDYDIHWGWARGPLEPGFTAVIRVKNEARSLPWVIPPLLRAVRRVIVVDNGSSDGSAELARRLAEEDDSADRLAVRSYPFDVARCGAEHLATPPDSVASLTYFYNWSFAQVRTRYALKWDGDMVPSDALVGLLRDLAWQLESQERILVIPRVPLYVAGERLAFLDTGMKNAEPWGWPNGPSYRFFKGFEWELCPMPSKEKKLLLPEWGCIELKHLDEDEFANWSTTEFDASSRTRRKEREWSVFNALAGGGEPPEGVIAIEAPKGTHVIDFVRTTWLRERVRESAAPEGD
jgi:hypothetical protein